MKGSRQSQSYLIAAGALALVFVAIMALRSGPTKMGPAQETTALASPEPLEPAPAVVEAAKTEASAPTRVGVSQNQVSAAIRPVKPKEEIKEETQAEIKAHFADQLAKLEQVLPTREIMKNKTIEEVHDTPQEVMDAGERMGLLKKAWIANPELKPQARDFYQSCASRADLLTPIRSLCLVNLRALNKALGQRPMDESGLPQNIRNVADQIPQ